MVAGVYDNAGISPLTGYPLNISLELSPDNSYTGMSSGLISTNNGSITFTNLRINSPGTYKFIAKSFGLISGSSSDIVINSFSLDSIKLKPSVSSISAYFSFILSVYLLNEIGSVYSISELVTLTADLEFRGSKSISTSLGIGNFSVYAKEPGLITFIASCKGKFVSEQLKVLPNIIKFDSINPIVIPT